MKEQNKNIWRFDYISKVPPIYMKDPLIEIIGQTDKPIPYYYEEAVKITGHSCAVVAAAWTMTKLALERLYPEGEIPVRGQIQIEMPGSEDEWNLGVFGEVMSFITGACAEGGFSGSIFAKGNQCTIRRNKMIYKEKASGTPPPKMKWIFTRLDTGKKIAISWNMKLVQPAVNEKTLAEEGYKIAAGKASKKEAEQFIKNWNDSAVFVLNNKVKGLFVLTDIN